MAEEDEDKIAFYAGERVFCYKKMPFGLKNAGATYQRLVDKLNPKKCSFCVEECPFLGHLVTKQGIKSNPSKVKAVTDLDQPRTLKDIQSLNGKLAALSRFLSKGAKRSLAFFKVLKGCKDKKNIQRTTEADEALEKMKKLIQALPTLTAPRVGETITMHIAASKESISKRNEGWTSIYFVSRVLQGAELNYPALEKLVLALLHATRRLRRYFQAHSITDNEKKEKPKEVPDSNSKWRLYTDGATNSNGSGVRLILIDLEGKEYTYALCFVFETTNNEAEYEDLLAVDHVRRNQNKKADALSKLASMTFKHLIKEVLVEVLTERFNVEPRSLVVRITKQGYYWPSMHMEVTKAIQDYEKCKEQSSIRKAGTSGAIAAGSTRPFSHWGIHILGPLPMAPGSL
ncbi:reverse transcriptase domain-containing protein [Tanacetum coccineum]